MSIEKLSTEQRLSELETELKKAKNTLLTYKKNYEDFLLIASHDLNAPLRKLSTFVERFIIKFKIEPDDETANYLDRIASSVSGMRSLVDDLTILSSLDDEKNNFTKCDLQILLSAIIKDSKAAIAENNARITFSILPVVEGSIFQLKLLFETMIKNSLQFQKNNIPLEIKITSEKIKEDENKPLGLPYGKNYYKIEIADNGIGFDDNNAEKIFQPFQRLHGRSEYEGNGFGLAICKKIVENHHGIIYAKSSKDSGCRFILILPEISN